MPLSRQTVAPLILRALWEDLGRGDVTSRALIPTSTRIQARILVKAPGIVAGTMVAQWVFQAVDRRIRCAVLRRDGQSVRRGQTILRLQGPAHGILAAERTALNFLGHLSGIATLTSQFVRQVRPSRAKIMDTRKTLPGLRVFEKYAVRIGGGQNHRRGLDDAVLIKTNHLHALEHRKWGMGNVDCGLVIQEAIARAKRITPKKFVEIEVTNLQEFKVALEAQPDAILLDNWSLGDIRKAVRFRNSTFPARPGERGAGGHIPHSTLPLLEVSGGVTLANIRAIARTGVDRISIGRLTHSAPSLDVSLKVA